MTREIRDRKRFQKDQLVYGDFKNWIKYITPYDGTGDADCLRKLSIVEKYLGMIGSKNKVRITRENLLKEGYTLEQLDEVHAPIGIPLGGQLPEKGDYGRLR